jgi:hypothetical protein
LRRDGAVGTAEISVLGNRRFTVAEGFFRRPAAMRFDLRKPGKFPTEAIGERAGSSCNGGDAGF